MRGVRSILFRLKWIDSDMHLCEPVHLWEAYSDPQYKQWMTEACEHFVQIPEVSRDSKAKILRDNCARLYNLT